MLSFTFINSQSQASDTGPLGPRLVLVCVRVGSGVRGGGGGGRGERISRHTMFHKHKFLLNFCVSQCQTGWGNTC